MSEGSERRLNGSLIGTGIVLVLLLVFVIQNTDTVSFTLLVFDLSMPLWLLAVILFAIGAAVGWITRWRSARRR
jgi:uncharacterized integral membrane protein